LLFAFAHIYAIYTIALGYGRSRSFYKWAGERAKISLRRQEMHVSLSFLHWNFNASVWDF